MHHPCPIVLMHMHRPCPTMLLHNGDPYPTLPLHSHVYLLIIFFTNSSFGFSSSDSTTIHHHHDQHLLLTKTWLPKSFKNVFFVCFQLQKKKEIGILFVGSKEPFKPSHNEVDELLSTALEYEVWPFSSNPLKHLQFQELQIVGDKEYVPF